MGTLTSLSSRSLQYYVISRKWLSDLEFYKFETVFLHSLLDEQFFYLPNNSERAKVADLNNELTKFEADKDHLERSLCEQIRQLELMSEDVIPEDTGSLAGKQIGLEHMVTDMMSEYKHLKLKIFTMVQRSKSDHNASLSHRFPN